MSTMNIEDTLRPETLNEVLLVDRIRQLQREHWDAERRGGMAFGFGGSDPNAEEPLNVPYLAPSLRLAGSFEAKVEAPGTLNIRARTEGPTKFGLGHYVAAEALATLAPGAEARLFDTLWREGMHSLAKELRRIQDATE